MLLFQEDYLQLRNKIGFFKTNSLEVSIVSEFTPTVTVNSFHSTLNRAFVEEEEDIQNEFIKVNLEPFIRETKEREDVDKIREALQVVENHEQPF